MRSSHVVLGSRALAAALTVTTCGVAAWADDPASSGDRLFQDRCALCHGAGGEGGGRGPALAGVMGRRAGSTDFGYSRALRDAGFTWDRSRLDHYLANPAVAVPGTIMPVNVPEPEVRKALVGYLATLKASAAGASVAQPAVEPPPAVSATAPGAMLTGEAAFGDWTRDAPGVRRRITVGDLPPPFETRSASNASSVVERPAGAVPQAPPGFTVDLFADGFDNPRVLRVAPNGDVFVAETAAGKIRILRGPPGGARAETRAVFVEGLDEPFGMAFYPPGPEPRWLYVAETNRVLRFPYRAGELKAAGRPEVVVPQLAGSTGGHSTRDIAFSPDGSRLFVSVGSASNVAQGMDAKSPADAEAWEKAHGLGAAWGAEAGRADVLSFTPEGKDRRIFATGLRNCVGLAVHPSSGDLWCSTNERDGLGDDLVPDYVTRVREGAWYGWPWYYLGDHEDPRLKGRRPDLKGRATLPDTLLQAHSASLGLAIMSGMAFPPAYRGDAFAAEHGSWNRAKRTGYKVVRIRTKDGVPTGEYEDFLTGFVIDDRRVWGRPVGVAVARDGALLVSEDGNGTIWRVAPSR